MKKQTSNLNKTYPAFQNVRNISQELHLLLASDKEHEKVFCNAPVARLRNSKSFKDRTL